MRIIWLSTIFSISFLGLAFAAQVTTDRLDYPPGDTVWIMGSGFSGGESVTVQVTHVDTLVTGGVGHNPWTVKANGGAFTTYWVVPYDDNGGESLKVTATGKTSGRVAFAYFMDVNTILTFVTIPETVNVGDTFCITANLKENCGGNPDAPLVDRKILFFLTEANCGVDVGQASPDSDQTDSLGNATGCLVIPNNLPPGNYGVRIKFRGEDKPNPCTNPNSACDTTKCVELSNSNECKGIVAVTNVCPQLTLTAPASALVCQGGSVCIYLSATDANSADVISLSKLAGVSIYAGKSGSSPLSDTFCFVPSSSGSYTFIFRASDGTCFDDDTVTVAVTINSPPNVTGPADKNVFLCTCNEAKLIVLKPFTFSDVNNNIQSKTTNKGTLSGDSVYYTSTSCNPDTIIVTVTDSCGAQDKDTVIVTKTLNSAPVVTGPPDKNVFLCACNEAKLIVLKPFVFSDPNSNIQSRTTNKGTLSGDSVYYTSTSCNPDTIIVTVTDSCGVLDKDTVIVTKSLDVAPVVTAPDSSKKLCAPGNLTFQVCATDGDAGDTLTLEKCNGNGSFPTKKGLSPVCQNFTFTADTCGTYVFCFKVTDQCGAVDFDTAVWVVEVDNAAPVVTAPDSSKNICNPDTLMFQVCATSTDCGDTLTLEKTSGGGTFTTKVGPSPVCQTLKFYADTSGTYRFIFKATDECGKTDYDTAVWVVKVDKKPNFTSCPPNQNASICNPGVDSLCFTIAASDPDGDSLCLKKLSGSGTFPDVCNSSSISKVFCFKPTTSGTYTFVFEAKEKGPCGKADTCTFSVTVTVDASPPVVTAPDSTKKLCAPSSITFQVCATDGDAGDTLTLEKCNGNGSFPTKKGISPVCQNFTFTPDTCGTYVFCFKVTDQCGKVDYDTAVWKVEIDAVAPVVSAPDSNKTICKADTLSFQVCATDSDCGDTLTLEKTSGGGTFLTKVGPSPVCQTLKFYADTSGTYRFIFKATDECGKADIDTAVWVIKVNNEPVIICPSNGYVTVCTLGTPVCRQIMAYDLNGDSICLNKISGAGNFPQSCGDSQVVANFCFVPDSSGVYQFSFEAKEKNGCGKADTCMYTITVKLDSFPPVVNAPDSTKRICQTDTIKFTVCATDGDFGDSVTLEKCSGYGSFTTKKGAAPVCQEFKFFADTCGTYKFCFKATDQCGKVAYDTAVYKVEVNKSAPVVTAPDGSKSFCGPDTLKFQVCASDPDCSDSVKLEKVSGIGSFPTKTALPPVCETLRAYVDTSGTYKFVFKATDECGKTDLDTAVWTVTINKKPVITAPDTVSFVLCEEGNQVCFNISANGGDGDSVCIEKVSGPGNLTKVCGKPQAQGQFCWTPGFSDTNKCYAVVFKATDSCGLMAFDTVTVCILPPDTLICGPCIVAAISEDTASPGSKVKIPIVIKANDTDIGGFSFCLEYDPALLTFIDLERGVFFDQPGPFAGSYMWNYLVWRNNPSTVIHKFKLCIIGIGKLYHYGGVCLPPGGQGVLYVEFRLSNNELYRCYRTPVTWERLDPQCIVNAFTDCSGNNVYVPDDTLFYNPKICDSTALWPKQGVKTCVSLRDGGVVFKCDVDPIVIGDINANGFAYEIGDAVLFANYFISGLSVFSSDPEIRERQIASSDVNRDGLTLSIADLVYLLRILAGDTQPLGGSKIAPLDEKAKVLVDNNSHIVEIHSPVDLGAVLMTFQGEASKLEPLISGLEVKWGKLEGQTKVLIYGMKKGEKIPAGISKLVKIYGDVELLKVEAAEYYGMPVDVDIVIVSTKPENYLLSQNYPNPFNANTTIKFATPVDGKVSLKIYNVAGQLVKEYSEFMNAGYHSITWDGTGSNGEKISSGVYLYKLQIGGFTEVRKMTLLK